VDKPLSHFARRRLAWWLAAAAAGLVLVGLVGFLRTALRPAGLYTGVLLYALVVGLALFNGRKKLPFLPLARASTWLQIHIYVGWLAVLVFFLHIGFRWPEGAFVRLLAAVFLLVAASGVVGLALTRWLPGFLARSGEPLTYERIPEHRAEIRTRIEALVTAADRESDSSTLGDFYLNHLMDYLEANPGPFPALDGQDRPYRRTVEALASLERYFNAREREVAAALREWIEAKRNLDNQLVAQRLLKLWLFVHIPASASLLLLGLVHGIIALRYAGGF
jgi:hypothetical protein